MTQPLTDNAHTRHLKAVVLLVIIFLPDSQAFAEGAVRTFHCTLERVCDTAGVCVATEGDMEFRLEPQQLDDNGAGSYRLAYEDNNVAMQAYSDAGPFTWRIGSVQHSLLVNAENRLLWHSLSLEAPLQSRSHYLECTMAE